MAQGCPHRGVGVSPWMAQGCPHGVTPQPMSAQWGSSPTAPRAHTAPPIPAPPHRSPPRPLGGQWGRPYRPHRPHRPHKPYRPHRPHRPHRGDAQRRLMQPRPPYTAWAPKPWGEGPKPIAPQQPPPQIPPPSTTQPQCWLQSYRVRITHHSTIEDPTPNPTPILNPMIVSVPKL